MLSEPVNCYSLQGARTFRSDNLRTVRICQRRVLKAFDLLLITNREESRGISLMYREEKGFPSRLKSVKHLIEYLTQPFLRLEFLTNLHVPEARLRRRFPLNWNRWIRQTHRWLSIFDLIVQAEKHKQVVWTAGRVLREAALWKRVRGLDYDERKIVLKRITGILDEFALKGHLQRRNERQTIGYGSEIGFDYIPPKKGVVSAIDACSRLLTIYSQVDDSTFDSISTCWAG